MRKQLPLLVLAFALVGCGITPKEANEKVNEGHKLWDEGKKTEAVAKYKEALPDNPKDVRFREEDRPKVFYRIIEFDLEKGDESSAKKFIERAVTNKVTLTLDNEKAKTLMAQVEREVADRESAAKAKKEADEKAAAERKAKQNEEERQRQAKQSEEEKELQTLLVVAVEQLLADFETNPIAAAKKYRKGQVIEVSGTIDNIDRTFLRSLFITMRPNSNYLGGVQCFFSDDKAEEIEKLKKGQRVSVRGVYNGKDLTNHHLNDSSLIGPEGSGSPKLQAFRQLAGIWETYIGVVGNDKAKSQWLMSVRKAQEQFISIPFDAKTQKGQALEMAVIFQQKLKGVGEMIVTYDTTGNIGAADELALWRELSKHLSAISRDATEK